MKLTSLGLDVSSNSDDPTFSESLEDEKPLELVPVPVL